MKKGLKKLLALGLVAVMGVAMVGCGQEKSKDKDVLSQIKSSGKLIVGTSPDYPPFEFVIPENGKSKIVGADIDVAQKIADKIGVKLEVKAMDFDALIPALKANKVDMVITGMTPNEKRKQVVDFSDIYFKGENAVVVKADNVDKIKNESELKKMKIGVQKGSTQETYAKDTLKAEKITSMKSVNNLILDLKNGNIDAVILNSKVAKLTEGKISGIKVANTKLTTGGDEESMAIAINKGNNASFLKDINEEIKTLNSTGEYDKILTNAVNLVEKAQNN